MSCQKCEWRLEVVHRLGSTDHNISRFLFGFRLKFNIILALYSTYEKVVYNREDKR
jgi:hypothetical protein